MDTEITKHFQTTWEDWKSYYAPEHWISPADWAEWDRQDPRAAQLGRESLLAMLALIEDLRQRGYDQRFRAGQSMASFVLSTAREHGLHPDQACVVISPDLEGAMELSYHKADYTEVVQVAHMRCCPELIQLLEKLAQQEVD